MTAQQTTGPEPAAGAVHAAVRVCTKLASLCVTPAHALCVRVPEPAASVPAIGSETLFGCG